MRFKPNRKIAFALAGLLAFTAVAAPQLEKLIKVGGVLVVVNNFGRQMNDGINKLWGREQSKKMKTKVVPILTVGLNAANAIGAAQVMGPPGQVDKVVAVAQPEARILGGELRLRALIPVSSKNVVENIRAVESVGVSGIVDIKL